MVERTLLDDEGCLNACKSSGSLSGAQSGLGPAGRTHLLLRGGQAARWCHSFVTLKPLRGLRGHHRSWWFPRRSSRLSGKRAAVSAQGLAARPGRTCRARGARARRPRVTGQRGAPRSRQCDCETCLSVCAFFGAVTAHTGNLKDTCHKGSIWVGRGPAALRDF